MSTQAVAGGGKPHQNDLLNQRMDDLLSLTEAAGLLPRRRRGKKPHVATLYRWAQAGCRGVVLETVQVGGTKCTSVAALQRFFSRLSGVSAADQSPRAERLKSYERADRELKEGGW